MSDYIFSADLLNKYSQLTPWVQAFIILALSAMIIFIAYFIKEYITLLTKPFCKQKPANSEDKKEWKDKYYRDDKKH